MEKDDRPHVHRPEFVLLEKEQIEAENESQNPYFQTLSALQKIEPSYGLRIVILLSLVLVAISACVVIFFFLINALVAAIVLFQNPKTNRYLSQSWKNVKKLLVFLAGAALGVFSPFLGIGCIILYFMKEKIPLNQGILSRFYKFKSN